MTITGDRPRGARARRQQLRTLLEADLDLGELRASLLSWAAGEPHALRTLFAALFDIDDHRRGRAIEALGWLAAEQVRGGGDLETVRDWIRRILWNMMEESGGLMWHGPEAIGAILAHVPRLIPEYVGPLGSYRVEEPFEAGTYAALARLAGVDPASVAVIAEHLAPGLSDPDPRIRAHASLALGRIGHEPALEPIAGLTGDESPVSCYDPARDELLSTTVGELAQMALAEAKPR